MTDTPSSFDTLSYTRRDLLRRSGMGFAALGLAGLLPATPGAHASGSPSLSPLLPKAPHFPGKAKRVIHLFMNGGPSHVDTFDPSRRSPSTPASRCRATT